MILLKVNPNLNRLRNYTHLLYAAFVLLGHSQQHSVEFLFVLRHYFPNLEKTYRDTRTNHRKYSPLTLKPRTLLPHHVSNQKPLELSTKHDIKRYTWRHLALNVSTNGYTRSNDFCVIPFRIFKIKICS